MCWSYFHIFPISSNAWGLTKRLHGATVPVWYEDMVPQDLRYSRDTTPVRSGKLAKQWWSKNARDQGSKFEGQIPSCSGRFHGYSIEDIEGLKRFEEFKACFTACFIRVNFWSPLTSMNRLTEISGFAAPLNPLNLMRGSGLKCSQERFHSERRTLSSTVWMECWNVPSKKRNQRASKHGLVQFWMKCWVLVIHSLFSWTM